MLPPDSIGHILNEHQRRHFERDLALQHRSRSRASALRSILVAELVRLEDSTSKGLRDYGSVNPRVEHLIDPRLQTLHILLATILARLGHSPVRSAPTPPEDP